MLIKYLSRTSLLLSQWCEPQVRLDDAEVREEVLGLLVGNRWVHNHVVAGDPVDGRGDPVLVSGLQTVEHAQNLGGVAAGRGRVGHDKSDGLLWVDDENGADGESNALGIDICCVLIIKHVKQVGNLSLLVCDDGELEVAARDLVDVLHPLIVTFNRVGRKTNELRATASKLRFELCEGTELGGTDGGLVRGVREEDDPVVADELVEVDRSISGLGLEIGSSATQTERLCASFGHCGVLEVGCGSCA
jgi:hypothetical protein